MIIWYGHRFYGTADRTAIDGHTDHAETLFFHLYGLPILPVASCWKRDGGSLAIAPHTGNIVGVYARWWGIIGAALVAMAAASLSPWCALGLVPCAAVIWRGFHRRTATARELRRGDFALATYGNRCPPHLLLPATRARLTAELSARWPEVGGGRPPEDVARLGARSADEAAMAYMLLVLASQGARGREAAALATAADRILDGELDPAADGPFRVGQITVAPMVTRALVAISLVEPPRRPAIPAPVSRSERWLTRILWWGLACAATLVGAVLFAQALEPPPLLTAADLEPPTALAFGNPISLARPDALECTKLVEIADDAGDVRTTCTTLRGPLVLHSDVSLTACETPCTVWGPPGRGGLIVKAIAPSRAIRLTPVIGDLARLRCERIEATDETSGAFQIARCTTGDDTVELGYEGALPVPGLLEGIPHGSRFVVQRAASRAEMLGPPIVLIMALPALAIWRLFRRRRATS